MLATDTQKNTVYAYAREHRSAPAEEFAARLARHFLGGAITRARVEVMEVAWTRLGEHAFTQTSREQRIGLVVAEAAGSTSPRACKGSSCSRRRDSEFHGFPRDRYTTLAETATACSRPRSPRAGATTASADYEDGAARR